MSLVPEEYELMCVALVKLLIMSSSILKQVPAWIMRNGKVTLSYNI